MNGKLKVSNSGEAQDLATTEPDSICGLYYKSQYDHHHCLVFDILLFLSEVLHRHQTYSVDCSRANNGLFCGIFVTVVTIVTIVVFFVLIASDNPALRQTAITLGSVTELALYSFSTTAVLIGIVQVRLTST